MIVVIVDFIVGFPVDSVIATLITTQIFNNRLLLKICVHKHYFWSPL